MRIIAIDQGTTSTRGFLLDEADNGKIICSRQHRQIYPHDGWVEHDPEQLLSNIIECLDAAGPVDAIGIDNQGESCLAWNALTGEPVSPVIVWQDRRTQDIIARLKADDAEQLTMARAGLPLDPYFSASKLAWIMHNIPKAKELHQQGNLRLATTDAFFIERLTGNYYTDITTATRTSLLNIATGEWDADLCEMFGVPIDALPQIKPTMGEFGTVELAGKQVPITASIVDQQASLYGHGCRVEGDAKITFGTGAFALALTGDKLKPAPEKGLLPTIAWQAENGPTTYALDGGVYCASSAINWARSLGLFSDFEEISHFSSQPAITRNLAFIPALTGLGCPYWDGTAAGMWIGMSLDTSKHDMVQAILEGIALRAVEVINTMASQIAIGDTISIDGGMSANPYFCQFLADVMQKSISVPSISELTALGTALLARGPEASAITASRQVIYKPQQQYADEIEHFAEAVNRSRGWRR